MDDIQEDWVDGKGEYAKLAEFLAYIEFILRTGQQNRPQETEIRSKSSRDAEVPHAYAQWA